MAEKSLKKNAVFNVIKTLMGILFPIITFPYASRILLPDGIGKVNFANSIVAYFALLAGLGISTHGTREAAKIRNDKNALSKLVKELFFINIISTIAAYVLFFLALFLVPKFYDYRVLLLISSLTLFFSAIGFGWVYSALEEYGYITARTILFQLISLALLFIFVKSREDYPIYLAIGVFSSVGSNLLNAVHLRKYVTFKTFGNLEIKKHLKPIFVLFGMSVITSIYTMLDTTMLGFLVDDAQVGFYTAATKLNKLVLIVVTSACAVLFPRLSFHAGQADKTMFTSLLNKSFSITLCFAIPATIGLNLLSEPITLLFSGETYLPSVPVMKMMNPIIVIISVSNFIGIQCLIPLNKEKITLYSVCVGAVINFTLNIILIPEYGAFGAAIATLVAESSVTIFQLIVARHYITLGFALKSIVQYSIGTLVMGFCVLLIRNFINELFLQVVLSTLGGVVSYIVVLIAVKNETALNVVNFLKSRFKGK